MGKPAFLKFFVYVSVLKEALGGALGADGGWLPLPTRPQRYCDPASLVLVKCRRLAAGNNAPQLTIHGLCLLSLGL